MIAPPTTSGPTGTFSIPKITAATVTQAAPIHTDRVGHLRGPRYMLFTLKQDGRERHRLALSQPGPDISSMRAGIAILLMTALAISFVPLVKGSDLSDLQSSVLLDSGARDTFRWNVLAGRDRRQSNARRPCIQTEIQPQETSPVTGVSFRTTRCGSLASTPIVSALKTDLKSVRAIVLAMAFPSSVSRVVIHAAGHKKYSVKLRSLSRFKATKARIVPFNFAVKAFAGNFCLTRFLAQSRNGQVLEDSGPMTCPR